MLRFFGRQILTPLLIFQIGIGYNLAMAGADGASTGPTRRWTPNRDRSQSQVLEQSANSWLEQLPTSTNLNSATREQRTAFRDAMIKATLYGIGQRVEKIGSNGQIVQSWEVGKTNLRLEEVSFGGIRELTFDGDRSRNEIYMSTPLRGGYRYRIAIPNLAPLKLQPVTTAKAGTMILFSTDDGIFFIPAQAEKLFFKTFVPVYQIMPKPEDAEIVDFNFMSTRGDADQLDLLADRNPQDLILDGDLTVTLRSTKDQKIRHVPISRGRLQIALMPHMLYTLGQILNLGLGGQNLPPNVVRDILRDFVDEMGSFQKEHAQEIDSTLVRAGADTDLIQNMLASFAAQGGDKFLASMVHRPRGSNGKAPAFLEALAASQRDGETVERLQQKWDPATLVRAALEPQNVSLTESDLLSSQADDYIRMGLRSDIQNRTDVRKKINRAYAKLYTSIRSAFTATMKVNTYKELGAGLVHLAKKPVFLGTFGIGTFLVSTSQEVKDGIAAMWSRYYVNALETPVMGSILGFFDRVVTTVAQSSIGKEIDASTAEWSTVTMNQMVTQWAPVTVGAMAFLLGAYYLVGLVPTPSDMRSLGLSRLQKVYSLGVRAMAYVNRAVQSLILEKVFRQQIAYALHNNGENPLAPRNNEAGIRRFLPAGLHRPWASQESINQRVQDLEAGIDAKVQAGPFAEYVTALMVSYLEQNPDEAIDPASITTALQLQSGLETFNMSGVNTRVSLTAAMLKSPEFVRMVQEATPFVAEALVKYANKVDIRKTGFDKVTYEFFLEKFRDVVRVVKSTKDQDLAYKIRNRTKAFKQFISKDLLPFVLLGAHWRRWSIENRYAIISKKVAHMAATSGPIDYWLSTLWGVVISPGRHIDFAEKIANPDFQMGAQQAQRAAVVPAMVTEQSTFQWTLTPVGAQSVAAEEVQSEKTFAPDFNQLWDEPPISCMWSEKSRQEYAQKLEKAIEHARELFPADQPLHLPVHRKQTVKEALSAIAKRFTFTRYAQSWAGYLKKLTADTTQAYIVLGAPFVASGFMYSLYNMTPDTSHGIGFWLSSFSLGVLANIGIILVKYTPSGYAWLWPFAHMFHHDMYSDVEHNLKTIQTASWNIAQALKTKNRSLIDKSVEEIKQLYVENKMELPAKFQKPANEYQLQDVLNLAWHGMENPPGPTKENQVVAKGLISLLFLAIGTTILYYVVYGEAYSIADIYANQGTREAYKAMGLRLLSATGLSIGTYLGLQHVIPGLGMYWQKGKDKVRSLRASTSADKKVVSESQLTCSGLFAN